MAQLKGFRGVAGESGKIYRLCPVRAAKAARHGIQVLPTTHVSEEASKFLSEARSCTSFNI